MPDKGLIDFKAKQKIEKIAEIHFTVLALDD